MDKVERILRRQELLQADRSIFEAQWREVNYVVAPEPDRFMGSLPTQGMKWTQKLFDETATLALPRFAAALDSSLTPSTSIWHKLTSPYEWLKENHEVSEYYDLVNKILYKARYNASANFANQIYEIYLALGKWGTGALFIDEDIGNSLIYKSIDITELYIAENSNGIVDTVYRKFRLSAVQAEDKFGYDALPEMTQRDTKEAPDVERWYIHAVEPNKDYNPMYADSMRYTSHYIAYEDRTILQEGGYRTFPYAVSRYRTLIREKYGRSPSIDSLASNKMLQQMAKTYIRSAHKQADPPLMLPENGVLNSFDTSPGALNFGGIGIDGRPLAIPLQTGGNFEISLEMMNRQVKIIEDAFLITLFQIFVQTASMTATEAMYRQQEKAFILAPIIGRQQSELLARIIERELDILERAGMLPPPPDELLKAGGGNGWDYKIVYESSFTLAQKASGGISIMNTLQAATGIAQADPSVLDAIDFDAALREIADVNGAPAKILRSKEAVAQMKEAQRQQAQMQQILQSAPVIAQTAETLQRTQNMSNQSAPRMG